MLPLAARTFVQSYFWSGHFNNASRVQFFLSPVERPDADSNLAHCRKLDYIYVVKLKNIYPTLTLSSMVQKALHVFHLVTIALLSCHCPPGHRKSCEAGVSCLISTNTTAILMHLGYHRQCRGTNSAWSCHGTWNELDLFILMTNTFREPQFSLLILTLP